MRLLSITPLRYLINHGLAQANVELVRTYLGLSERLKFTEQKLNYLTRCKKDDVYPVFILTGVKVVSTSFGGMKTSYITHLEDKIRKSSLSYHINQCYQEIRELKYHLHCTKHRLHTSISDQFMFHEIMCTANDYSDYVKRHHKARLRCKYNWLLCKYYQHRLSDNVNNIQKPPSKPPEDPVTILNIADHPLELSEDEINLLSLGPGFAVAPDVNDKLLNEVEVSLAQCSYSMKWKQKMTIVGSDTSTPRSANSEIKKACPKLQTPFFSTPPTIGVTQDVMMRNLSDFVINTVKNSTVKTNLTRS